MGRAAMRSTVDVASEKDRISLENMCQLMFSIDCAKAKEKEFSDSAN